MTNISHNSNPARKGVSVELRGLAKFYKDTAALKGLDLKADAGELIVLLGPSGCGKTTALRALAGLERLDGGRVLIGDRDVTDLPAAKRSIGMVFQSYSLFPNMTARANVEFGLRVRKMSSSSRNASSNELLELVGLSAQADRYPHQLSGGQQQRIALARALAIRPEVLLLDEPLSALDAQVRSQLRDEIRRIQLELGITAFFVTHDQEEALALADRIAVMNGGEIDQIDTPLSVYSNPKTEFVAEFVGKVNRLSGVVIDHDKVDTEVIGPVDTSQLSHNFRSGAKVDVLIRPESVGVIQSTTGDCTIISRSFLGSTAKITARTSSNRSVAAELPANESSLLDPNGRISLFAKGPALLIAEPRN